MHYPSCRGLLDDLCTLFNDVCKDSRGHAIEPHEEKRARGKIDPCCRHPNTVHIGTLPLRGDLHSLGLHHFSFCVVAAVVLYLTISFLEIRIEGPEGGEECEGERGREGEN